MMSVRFGTVFSKELKEFVFLQVDIDDINDVFKVWDSVQQRAEIACILESGC